jgi:hypothetical protein
MPRHDDFFESLGYISILIFFLCALCDYLQITFLSFLIGFILLLSLYILILFIFIKLSYIKI